MADGPRAITIESEPAAPVAVYRPHLDGLRAVAVYLVVLFHAGSASFPGGFVGVDVFFVLSGYLVTQLLLRDLDGRGSIRFGRFYARRFRRLLPAAFVALIVTAIVFSAIASPVEVSNAIGSLKSAFLYSTNWYFIHQSTDYFGANLSSNPVLQFWSLAVEEQFYLVWPLALGGVFVATRRLDQIRRRRAIRILIAVAALASAGWALSLRATNPNRAYYGTDARAYELLAGALIAFLPALVASAARFRRSMRITAIAGVVALFVVASSWIHLDAIERGIATTITTCVLLVAIEAADRGFIKGALSTRSATYLGQISYGTYLWHWLVILVVARSFHLSTIATVGVTCLIATALAALSYEILEQPVRTSRLLDGHRRIVIVSGLAISVISAIVLIPAIVQQPDASVTASDGATSVGFTPVPNLDWARAAQRTPFVSCVHKPVAQCTVVHGRGRSILLIGDSHAAMLMPAFIDIARRHNLTLSVSTRGLCAWQRSLDAKPEQIAALAGSAKTGIDQKGCQVLKDDLYQRVLPTLNPDVVVAIDSDNTYIGPAKATAQSVQELLGKHHKVILIEDMPLAAFNPLDCLMTAKVVERCRYVANPYATPTELLYRKLAGENHDVHAANFDQIVCPFFPICDPIVNHQIVKWDPTHITTGFARSVAPQIDDYLRQLGVT